MQTIPSSISHGKNPKPKPNKKPNKPQKPLETTPTPNLNIKDFCSLPLLKNPIVVIGKSLGAYAQSYSYILRLYLDFYIDYEVEFIT